MNSLQGIDESEPLFVTLNPRKEIAPSTIYEQTVFRHPIFDCAAVDAQKQLRHIQGDNQTWFCGAYSGNGFHEDGYASAMAVVDKLLGRVVTP